ncbi:MAG: amidohydrolase [Solirubrobacterales bacterium]|nr:amidohydrolase [Solirubrobacterales bacterium]
MDRTVGAIDGCVHHRWAEQSELAEYLDAGWREYLGRPGALPNGGGAIPVVFPPPYRRPGGEALAGGEPGAPLASRAELVARELFERRHMARGVLCHGDAMMAAAIPNPRLAQAVVRAANDWTVERWLDRDERFRALILLASQTPEDAAAEIRRLAGDERMVGVLLAANVLARPFGHPAYRPIFEAAAEHELTVVIHAGGDAVAETLSQPTAGGVPSTFGEYYALSVQAMMTHVTSVIAQGLFDALPSLRVLVSGVGIGWLPALFWRFDSEYIALRRETPWLRKAPSEYLRERMYVGSHPLDRPADPQALVRLLRAFPGVEDLLVYGSGYPSWDVDWPEDVHALLPAEWSARLLHQNAARAFPRLDRSEVVV